MKKLDVDTQKEVEKSEKISALVNHRGWTEAKNVLLEKLAALDSISMFITDDDNADKMKIDFMARVSTIQIVREWLAEIEGTAEQHEEFMKSLQEKKSNDYILRK